MVYLGVPKGPKPTYLLVESGARAMELPRAEALAPRKVGCKSWYS
jgi:hypothetical protein